MSWCCSTDTGSSSSSSSIRSSRLYRPCRGGLRTAANNRSVCLRQIRPGFGVCIVEQGLKVHRCPAPPRFLPEENTVVAVVAESRGPRSSWTTRCRSSSSGDDSGQTRPDQPSQRATRPRRSAVAGVFVVVVVQPEDDVATVWLEASSPAYCRSLRGFVRSLLLLLLSKVTSWCKCKPPLVVVVDILLGVAVATHLR